MELLQLQTPEPTLPQGMNAALMASHDILKSWNEDGYAGTKIPCEIGNYNQMAYLQSSRVQLLLSRFSEEYYGMVTDT